MVRTAGRDCRAAATPASGTTRSRSTEPPISAQQRFVDGPIAGPLACAAREPHHFRSRQAHARGPDTLATTAWDLICGQRRQAGPASIQSATASATWSCQRGAATCTASGSPVASSTPAGTLTAGQPVRLHGKREHVVLARQRPMQRRDVHDDGSDHDVERHGRTGQPTAEPIPVPQLTVALRARERRAVPVATGDVERLVEQRRQRSVDGCAEAGQGGDRPLHRRPCRPRRLPRRLVDDGDPQTGRLNGCGIADRDRHAIGIGSVRSGDDPQRRHQVGHARRHRADHRAAVVAAADAREVARGRHQSERRLQPGDPAPRTRQPDAAARVAAEAKP